MPKFTLRNPRKFKRILFGLFCLMLLAGGYWWWQQPREFRVLAHYYIKNDNTPNITSYTTSSAGFLYREGTDYFIMRDWCGRERWRAKPDIFLHCKAKTKLMANGDISLSPDGHYFLIVTEHTTQLHLQAWHDGLLKTNLSIPRQLKSIYTNNEQSAYSMINNNGQALITINNAAGCDVYAVNDNHISAHGTFTDPLGNDPLGNNGRLTLISDDGSMMVILSSSRFIYINLYYAKGRITFHPRYSLAYDGLALFADGTVLSDGKLYRANGPIGSESGRYGDLSQGHIYIACFLQDGQVRVFSPLTDDHWQFPMSTMSSACQPADNGRYVLGCCPNKSASGLANFSRKIRLLPGLKSSADRLYLKTQNVEFLGVYERPGRLRAVLPLLPNACWQWKGELYRIYTGGYLSSDGKTVLVYCDGTSGANLFLFGW